MLDVANKMQTEVHIVKLMGVFFLSKASKSLLFFQKKLQFSGNYFIIWALNGYGSLIYEIDSSGLDC